MSILEHLTVDDGFLSSTYPNPNPNPSTDDEVAHTDGRDNAEDRGDSGFLVEGFGKLDGKVGGGVY